MTRSRTGNGADQFDDPIVGRISPAVPRVHHGNDFVRLPAISSGSIEHDGPRAAPDLRDRCDVADQPIRGLGAVAPPSIGTRAHHVVPVHEHSGRDLRCEVRLLLSPRSRRHGGIPTGRTAEARPAATCILLVEDARLRDAQPGGRTATTVISTRVPGARSACTQARCGQFAGSPIHSHHSASICALFTMSVR